MNELINFNTIRHIYDEKQDIFYFSVIDVVALLTEKEYQVARKYWNKLAERLKNEGADQSVTNCHRLKLKAKDGKNYFTDVADAKTMLRIVQSIPSPKAEPIKMWLAKTGYERMQETANPELSVDRARENWQKMGHSDTWIKTRLSGQDTRGKLTDYWADHEVEKGQEYATLTNIIHQAWTGLSVKDHKELKGIKSQNLRDHMSEAELIFTALAELTTRQIAEKSNATGMNENADACKKGGGVAKNARLDYEHQTGQAVISNTNNLKRITK